MPITIEHLEETIAQELTDWLLGVYLDGECYALAIALHRNLGWPIVGLMQRGTVRHALVRNTGNGILYDARGPVPEKKLGAPFGISPPYTLKEITESNLKKIRIVQDLSIARALDVAQRVWLDLPWQNSMQERARKFAEELERLSRKHNIWIRARVPATAPVLLLGEGNETGYTLSPFISGAICSIDRTLGSNAGP